MQKIVLQQIKLIPIGALLVSSLNCISIPPGSSQAFPRNSEEQEEAIGLKSKSAVRFGIEPSSKKTTPTSINYLLKKKRGKFPNLRTYLKNNGYPEDQLTNDILASLSRAISDRYPSMPKLPSNVNQFETWIQGWLETEYELKPLQGEIVIAFNVHSNEGLRELVELFDRKRKEKNNQEVIWVLENALLFEDLIAGIVTGKLDPYSNEMTQILKNRLREDPARRLGEMDNLRTPIAKKRANYIPNLRETPRIDYLMRHPKIGITIESLNNDLNIEHARSILLGAALKWRAFSALINRENENQFFSYMTESIEHYLRSQIYERDKIFAKQLLLLRKNYPRALILTDRGLDHMDSLLAYLDKGEFRTTPVTVYYPAAYRKESYGYLQFEPYILNMKEEELSDSKKAELMMALKRFVLHEMLSQSIFSYFPSTSSLAISNVAQEIIEPMSDSGIERMIYVVQKENKNLTEREKKKSTGKEILKWFTRNGFVLSAENIRHQLQAQTKGYIKKNN